MAENADIDIGFEPWLMDNDPSNDQSGNVTKVVVNEQDTQDKIFGYEKEHVYLVGGLLFGGALMYFATK